MIGKHFIRARLWLASVLVGRHTMVQNVEVRGGTLWISGSGSVIQNVRCS